MLSVRIPKTLEDRLEALSNRTHRAKSYYVKKALEKYLEEQEEIEWATAAYRDYLESGEKTTSWEDVKKQSGL